eukprot:gene13265-biopygen17014
MKRPQPHGITPRILPRKGSPTAPPPLPKQDSNDAHFSPNCHFSQRADRGTTGERGTRTCGGAEGLHPAAPAACGHNCAHTRDGVGSIGFDGFHALPKVSMAPR